MSLRRISSALPRPYDPVIDPFSQTFWEALENGEFLLARCSACESLQFPPRPHCPRCGHSDIGWQPSAGSGVLYASTRVHAAAGPFACMTPYSVGLIDLDEGVRVLTRLMHDASSLQPGSRIQLGIIEHTNGYLFVGFGEQK